MSRRAPQSSAARRRVLAELAALPGMGEEYWVEQKARSEHRMGLIDASPREWRDLVNEYGLEPVADLAKLGLRDAASARRVLDFSRHIDGVTKGNTK